MKLNWELDPLQSDGKKRKLYRAHYEQGDKSIIVGEVLYTRGHDTVARFISIDRWATFIHQHSMFSFQNSFRGVNSSQRAMRWVEWMIDQAPSGVQVIRGSEDQEWFLQLYSKLGISARPVERSEGAQWTIQSHDKEKPLLTNLNEFKQFSGDILSTRPVGRRLAMDKSALEDAMEELCGRHSRVYASYDDGVMRCTPIGSLDLAKISVASDKHHILSATINISDDLSAKLIASKDIYLRVGIQPFSETCPDGQDRYVGVASAFLYLDQEKKPDDKLKPLAPVEAKKKARARGVASLLGENS